MTSSLWTSAAVGFAVLAVAFLWWQAPRRQLARWTPGSGQPLYSTEIRYFLVRGLNETPRRYVGIVCGDIRRARCAEVWVNSENTNMKMARVEEFSVSSIIRYEGAERDAAGRVMRDCVAEELARRTAGSLPLPAATAVVTGSGELRHNGVRAIVHVASVQGEPGSGFRQVHEVGRCVTNVLAEVDRMGGEPPPASVLFPVLGVGQGGGELEPTIAMMLGAVVDHFRTVPTTCVSIVYLLAYTDRELEACARIFAASGALTALAAPPEEVPVTLAESGVTAAREAPPVRRRLQMGFVVDVIGYGARPGPAQERVQERLARLVATALLDCGTAVDKVDHQWTGDGFTAFLPSDIDPTTTLPTLIWSIVGNLAEDNRRDTDQIRLRMAVGIGSSAWAPRASPDPWLSKSTDWSTAPRSGRRRLAHRTRRWCSSSPTRCTTM